MRITKLVINIILWVFLAFALFTTIVALAAQGDKDGYPSFFGSYILTVSSDSMSGTFEEGDIILAKKLNNDEKQTLKKGDVITFRTNEIIEGKYVLNTHRIIEVVLREDGVLNYYVTHGDAVPAGNNETVYAADVMAIWNGGKANGLGRVLIFLQSPTGFLVCIVIPMALFFIYEIYVFVRTLVTIKRGDKKVISAEDEELIKQRAIEEYLKQQAAAQATANQPESSDSQPAEDETTPDTTDENKAE